jgi:hypothetical protein
MLKIAMTNLADYYCVLPTLSRSLYRALHDMSLDVARCKPELLPEVLAASCKLRYPDLFKECIILAAGRWSDRYGGETPLSGHSQKIRKPMEAARHKIGFDVAKANEQMLRIFSQNAQLGEYLKEVEFRADCLCRNTTVICTAATSSRKTMTLNTRMINTRRI